jgi:hypothetical protein
MHDIIILGPPPAELARMQIGESRVMTTEEFLDLLDPYEPLRLVTVSWPDDPDRGSETYGPFNDGDQELWVTLCQEAADLGWTLLQGAHYLIHSTLMPFNPQDLMADGSSSTLA